RPHLGRSRCVLALLLRQVAQQLADTSIGGAAGGGLVETPRFDFHQGRLLASGRKSQRSDQPDGFAAHEAFDILPANEGNVIAESLPVEIEEPVPVAVLF